MAVSAAVSVIPMPPALVDRRYTKPLPGVLNRSMPACRAACDVLPSKRSCSYPMRSR